MRICMLTSGHSPLDDRIFYKEVLTLKKVYNDIIIIAQHDKEYDEVDGIRIIGIPKRKNDSLKNRIKTLNQLYKKGAEVNADIYHCHEPDALYIGYKLSKKFDSRLIYDSHEYHPETFALHFSGIIRKVVKSLIGSFEKFIAGKCDYIITVNNILVSRFKKYNCNVLNLPNYPRLEFIKSNVSEKDLKGLVYVGGICEKKGCKKIIEAINKSSNSLNMSFIGVDEDGLIDAVSDLINLNEKSKIEFLGEVEHKNVFNLLGEYIIGFVLNQPVDPIYTNCQPIKLFEYMANGIAVIVGDYPLIREIVGREQCGLLVNPEDENEIAEAIDYMIENIDETLRMGERGRKAIIEKYNWECIESRLIKAYNEVIERKHYD